jgi:hypothetical protein
MILVPIKMTLSMGAPYRKSTSSPRWSVISSMFTQTNQRSLNKSEQSYPSHTSEMAPIDKTTFALLQTTPVAWTGSSAGTTSATNLRRVAGDENGVCHRARSSGLPACRLARWGAARTRWAWSWRGAAWQTWMPRVGSIASGGAPDGLPVVPDEVLVA